MRGVRHSWSALPMSRRGECGLVGGAMSWQGEGVCRKEIQGCNRQEGRDWGVRTHHDFGGAERQSIF